MLPANLVPAPAAGAEEIAALLAVDEGGATETHAVDSESASEGEELPFEPRSLPAVLAPGAASPAIGGSPPELGGHNICLCTCHCIPRKQPGGDPPAGKSTAEGTGPSGSSAPQTGGGSKGAETGGGPHSGGGAESVTTTRSGDVIESEVPPTVNSAGLPVLGGRPGPRPPGSGARILPPDPPPLFRRWGRDSTLARETRDWIPGIFSYRPPAPIPPKSQAPPVPVDGGASIVALDEPLDEPPGPASTSGDTGGSGAVRTYQVALAVAPDDALRRRLVAAPPAPARAPAYAGFVAGHAAGDRTNSGIGIDRPPYAYMDEVAPPGPISVATISVLEPVATSVDAPIESELLAIRSDGARSAISLGLSPAVGADDASGTETGTLAEGPGLGAAGHVTDALGRTHRNSAQAARLISGSQATAGGTRAIKAVPRGKGGGVDPWSVRAGYIAQRLAWESYARRWGVEGDHLASDVHDVLSRREGPRADSPPGLWELGARETSMQDRLAAAIAEAEAAAARGDEAARLAAWEKIHHIDARIAETRELSELAMAEIRSLYQQEADAWAEVVNLQRQDAQNWSQLLHAFGGDEERAKRAQTVAEIREARRAARREARVKARIARFPGYRHFVEAKANIAALRSLRDASNRVRRDASQRSRIDPSTARKVARHANEAKQLTKSAKREYQLAAKAAQYGRLAQAQDHRARGNYLRDAAESALAAAQTRRTVDRELSWLGSGSTLPPAERAARVAELKAAMTQAEYNAALDSYSAKLDSKSKARWEKAREEWLAAKEDAETRRQLADEERAERERKEAEPPAADSPAPAPPSAAPAPRPDFQEEQDPHELQGESPEGGSEDGRFRFYPHWVEWPLCELIPCECACDCGADEECVTTKTVIWVPDLQPKPQKGKLGGQVAAPDGAGATADAGPGERPVPAPPDTRPTETEQPTESGGAPRGTDGGPRTTDSSPTHDVLGPRTTAPDPSRSEERPTVTTLDGVTLPLLPPTPELAGYGCGELIGAAYRECYEKRHAVELAAGVEWESLTGAERAQFERLKLLRWHGIRLRPLLKSYRTALAEWRDCVQQLCRLVATQAPECTSVEIARLCRTYSEEFERTAESNTTFELSPELLAVLRDPTAACQELARALSPLFDVIGEVLEGIFLGEFDADPTMESVVANMLISAIPGFGSISSLRDAIKSGVDVWDGNEGAWIGLGLNLLGVLPVLGVAAKSARMTKVLAAARRANSAGFRGARLARSGAQTGSAYVPGDDLIKAIRKGANCVNEAVRKRIYRASPKHGPEIRIGSSGRIIGRAPRNPTLLDGAKGPGKWLVSVDKENGVFVVFRSEGPGASDIFHGFESVWDDLTQEQKNVLIKEGLAAVTGRIL